MEHIAAVFYINLDRRQDRRQQMESQLQIYQIKAERFPAISDKIGYVGCMKSHLEVYRLAEQRNYENVLILEDDFDFLVSPTELQSLLTDFFNLKLEYDIIMLGYNLKSYKEFNPLLYKVLEAQTASAYIIHKRFYKTLIELYKKTLPQLEEYKLFHLHANDQVWKPLQPNSAWYAFQRRIGHQRKSYSDLIDEVVDYKV